MSSFSFNNLASLYINGKEVDTLVVVSTGKILYQVGLRNATVFNYSAVGQSEPANYGIRQLNLNQGVEKLRVKYSDGTLSVFNEEELQTEYCVSGTFTDAMSLSVEGVIDSFSLQDNGSDYNKYLQSVTIGSSVKQISPFCFCDVNIGSQYIPETVQIIGEQAFKSSSINNTLTSVIVSQNSQISSLPYQTFYNDAGLLNFEFWPALTSVGRECFYNAGLTSVNILDNLQLIDQQAFRNTNILTLDLNVPDIRFRAFGYCSKLTDVLLGEKITKFGNAVFLNCTQLSNATLDNYKLAYLPTDTFNSCSNLSSIELPNNITAINDLAFAYCGKLSSINLDNVTKYGAFVFKNCYSIKEIHLADNCTSLGSKGCMFGCTNLTSVNIPTGISELPAEIFKNCYALPSMTIPPNITKINNAAFYFCTSMEYVTIPSSVVEIGDHAFSGNGTLKLKLKYINFLDEYPAGKFPKLTSHMSIDLSYFVNKPTIRMKLSLYDNITHGGTDGGVATNWASILPNVDVEII